MPSMEHEFWNSERKPQALSLCGSLRRHWMVHEGMQRLQVWEADFSRLLILFKGYWLKATGEGGFFFKALIVILLLT